MGQEIIYRNFNSSRLQKMTIDKLNNFQGANMPYLQVLKSAAGYYIGTLCKTDWNQDDWVPYDRDSDCYWKTRVEAEDALKNNDYGIKF